MNPNAAAIVIHPHTWGCHPDPTVINASHFIDELMSGLIGGASKPGFTANLNPTDDPFSNGWNAAMKYMKEHPTPAPMPMPVNVIFHDPATIVYWNDGSKTVVKCQPGDVFSAEAGLTTAMLKKYMGNDNTFNKVINEWLARSGWHSVPALPAAPETPALPEAAEVPALPEATE